MIFFGRRLAGSQVRASCQALCDQHITRKLLKFPGEFCRKGTTVRSWNLRGM